MRLLVEEMMSTAIQTISDIVRELGIAKASPDDYVCRIQYEDRHGKVTDRIISPIRVDAEGGYTFATCLGREQGQRFNLHGIQRCELVPSYDILAPEPIREVRSKVTKEPEPVQEPEPEVAYEDVRYFNSPALSRSDLSLFLESRRQFRAVKDGLMEYPADLDGPASADILTLGTAVHLLVLEPEKRSEIAVFDGSSRQGDLWKKFKRANRGRLILTQKQFLHALVMAEATKIVAAPLLKTITRMERWVEWEEVIDGRACLMKAKVDMYWPRGQVWIAGDLKTTPSVESREFRSSVRKYRYWLQDSHYSKAIAEEFGVDVDDVEFVFVAIGKSFSETLAKACQSIWDAADNEDQIVEGVRKRVQQVAPLICRLHELSAADRIRAQKKRLGAIRAYMDCLDSGDWSDPGESEVSVIEDVL